MSKKYFNEKAEKWDEFVQHNPEKINEVIDNIECLDSPKILDVGSGTGVLIPYLMNKFGDKSQITAVDFAENMIAVSKKKHKDYNNIDFIVGDIYSIKFQPDTYDVILCYSVFPHLTNKVSILKKFYLLLKEKGILVIFHSQSREAINSIHKSVGAEVERDNLPPAVKVTNIAKDIGFKAKEIIDDTEIYVVKLSKEN